MAPEFSASGRGDSSSVPGPAAHGSERATCPVTAARSPVRSQPCEPGLCSAACQLARPHDGPWACPRVPPCGASAAGPGHSDSKLDVQGSRAITVSKFPPQAFEHRHTSQIRRIPLFLLVHGNTPHISGRCMHVHCPCCVAKCHNVRGLKRHTGHTPIRVPGCSEAATQ